MSFALDKWCRLATGAGATLLIALNTASLHAQVATQPQGNTASGGIGRTVINQGSPVSIARLASERFAEAAANLGLTFSGNSLSISGVTDGGPLASLGLRVGDQITAINGRPVSNATDLLQRLTTSGTANLAASIAISRNGSQQILNASSSVLAGLAQTQASAAANAAAQTGTPTTQNGQNLPADATLNRTTPATGATSGGVGRTSTFNPSTSSATTTSAASVLQQALQQQAAARSVNGQSSATTGTTTGTGTTAATAGTGVAATTNNAAATTSGSAITQSGTGLIAPNAGQERPAGTISPPTVDPSRLPPGSFGTDNTTTGENTTTSTPTTSTPTTGNTGTANGTGGGSAVGQSSTGLIAPNAGQERPAGTISPPTVNPNRLPPGSFGTENTTTGENTTTSTPPNPTPTTGTTGTTNGGGSAVGQSSTGLIAPNAGQQRPAGTITPPTVDPSRLPPGSFGTENTTPGQNTTTATPAASGQAGASVAAPGVAAGASGQAASGQASANGELGLPSVVLGPSGPRVAMPQQGGGQGGGGLGASGGLPGAGGANQPRGVGGTSRPGGAAARAGAGGGAGRSPIRGAAGGGAKSGGGGGRTVGGAGAGASGT